MENNLKKSDELLLRGIRFFTKRLFPKMGEDKEQLLLQILKFGGVGVINTVVNYCVTVLFLFFGVELLICNAIAFVISTACAFWLNYFFVFPTRPCWWKGMLRSYCSYALTGIGLNSVLLYITADLLQISEYLCPLLVLLVTIPTNFLLNKLWTFRK